MNPTPLSPSALLSHRSIGMRLSLAFALLVSLLAGLGLYALGTLAQVNASMEELVARRYRIIELLHMTTVLHDKNVELLQQQALMSTLGRSPEDMAPLRTHMEENTKTFLPILQELRDRMVSEQERAAFATIEAARPPYITSRNQVKELLARGKTSDAVNLLFQETLPRQASYRSTWTALIALERDLMQTTVTESAKQYARVRDTILGVIGLAVLMAVLVALITTRGVTDPIARVVGHARQIAAGNLRERVLVTRSEVRVSRAHPLGVVSQRQVRPALE